MKKKNLMNRLADRYYAVLDKIPFMRNPFWNAFVRFVLASIGMVLLILAVYFGNVPNPNMILITGLVLFSCTLGWPAAGASVISMIVYSMFFFSTDHSFFTFNETNLAKVIVICLGSVISALLVCLFRRNARQEREFLTNSNASLEKQVSYDPLTGAKNRDGLRKDFEKYVGKDLFLLVLDIDDFKSINDEHGHLRGDESLVRFVDETNRIFGEGSIYRVGGDEFVILFEGNDTFAFEDRIYKLRDAMDSYDQFPIHFSAGYVQTHIRESSSREDLVKIADENLYEAKYNGKNRFKGTSER